MSRLCYELANVEKAKEYLAKAKEISKETDDYWPKVLETEKVVYGK